MTFCHTSIPLGKEQCGYGFVSGMIPYQTGVATATYSFKNLGKSWMWSRRITVSAMMNWRPGWSPAKRLGGKFFGNIYSPLGQVDYSAHHSQDRGHQPGHSGDQCLRAVHGRHHQAAGGGGTDQREDEIRHPQEPPVHDQGSGVHPTMKTSTAATSSTGLCRKNIPRPRSLWRRTRRSMASSSVSGFRWRIHGDPRAPRGDEHSQDHDGCGQAVKTLEGIQDGLQQGSRRVPGLRPHPDDQLRHRSWHRGQGLGLELRRVVAEIPWKDTLESCENNKKDVPYGEVKLPGK